MKILIIRLSSIGDIVLTTPVLHALKESYPDATIDFAVKKQFAPLIEYHPAINQLLIFDSTRGSLQKLKQEIKKNAYSLILDLHRNLRSFYLKFNSGSTTTRTLRKGYLKRFLLVHVDLNLFGKNPESIIDRYIQTAGDYLKAPVPRFPEVFIPKEILTQVEAKREKWSSPIIVMIPRAAHQTKEWPLYRFGKVGMVLAEERGATVIILAGPQKDKKNDIIRMIIGPPCLDYTGQTTLLETAAIISMADLVITVDTGCMHIGWAFRKKMVCIFGSTVRELGYNPEYSDVRIVENKTAVCRPCSHNGRKTCPETHFRCMEEITVDMVVEAANELLGPKKVIETESLLH